MNEILPAQAVVMILLLISILIGQRGLATNQRGLELRAETNIPNNESTISPGNQATVGSLPPPRSSAELPLRIQKTHITPSRATLRKRLEATLRHQEVAEEIRIRVEDRNPMEILKRIAIPEFRELLGTGESQDTGGEGSRAFLRSIESRLQKGSLKLDARDLRWIDLRRLSQVVKRSSVLPMVSLEDWEEALSDSISEARLKNHFGENFLSLSKHLRSLQEEGESEVSLKEFLPEHVRNLYGRYSAFRGRNCFATALLFANQKVIKDNSVNMLRESEHHYTMINSDEFANALWRGYVRLSAEQIDSGLRYGDVVVFLDRSLGDGYRALRHTAVHMIDDIYFHKPSKSASTPVEFTTWTKIVRVWARYTKDLDYEVYRKITFSTATYINNSVMSEKISWTP